jgi:hypothetical protein
MNELGKIRSFTVRILDGMPKAMKRELISNVLVFCLLVVLGVGTRWVSEANYPKLSGLAANEPSNISSIGLANFTAIGAISLFAGYFFRPRIAAFLVPLAVMVISNLCLRHYNNFPQMGIVYVALLLPVAIGLILRRNLKVWSVVTGALATSVTFFLITNFAEWAFYDLYPHTPAGLIDGYVAAIPFFRNTLLSDLLFSAVIFGSYWLAVSSGILERRGSQLAVAPIQQQQ